MGSEATLRCDICFHAMRFEFCLSCHVRRVTCSECRTPFHSFELFQKHLNEHKFSVDEVLECHFLLRGRRQRQLFACVFCSFLFTKITTLVQHERSVHRIAKEFVCAHCGSMCSSRAGIVQHLKLHNGEPSFECKKCDKKYHLKNAFEQHKKVHVRDLPYKCKFCDKLFKTEFVMKRHTTQHSVDKFYSCDLCDRSFLFNFSLQRHLRTHEASNDTFKCSHCEKVYNWKGDLSRHIRASHLKIRPHECMVCHKTFARKVYLLEHQTSHSQAKTHLCFCGKTFRHRSNLTRHKRTAHKNAA